MTTATITIDTPEGPIAYQLQENDFTIDPSSIDAQLCNMGRLMLDYGELETALRLEVERKEAALDKLEADLDNHIRLDASKSGIKITEAKVKNAILGNATRLELLESISVSRKNHNMMKWAMVALQSKRDCLINLSYRERQLMKADHF